jgi:hypothetical protein
MRYLVTAPCVNVPDETGSVHHLYRGEFIRWIPAAARAHLLDLGMVEEVPDPPTPGVAADVAAPRPAGDRPAATAPKDKWLDFVVSAGVDRAEAEKLTKDQLIELVPVPA